MNIICYNKNAYIPFFARLTACGTVGCVPVGERIALYVCGRDHSKTGFRTLGPLIGKARFKPAHMSVRIRSYLSKGYQYR